MDVNLSIGQTHRFELHEALLIYKGNNQSFITHHAVVSSGHAPPALGPAQPLSMTFVDSLLRSLRRGGEIEVLPDNVLAKSDQSLVWWTPPRDRQIFYRSSGDKRSALDGKVFPQPALVWRVHRGSLALRALMRDERPHARTKLAFAPFWNTSNNGAVCLGSMRHPETASVAAMDAWEQGFYESAFTHSNVARITRHPEGFEAMWSELAGKHKTYPSKYLIALPETLDEFVRGSRDALD